MPVRVMSFSILVHCLLYLSFYHEKPFRFPLSSAFCSAESHFHQVLSDDKKRAMYDQYGEAGVKSAVEGSPGAYTLLLFSSCSF